jgi:DNA repair protein RecO (recombination protein O)
MLEKTQGIVLGYSQYSETSIICRIFTQKFGLRGYIIKGVRQKGKQAQKKLSLYQTLNILELIVYHKDSRSLNHISEAQIAYPYQALPFEVRKTTIALFLAEVLRKCLQEEAQQEDLYHFLFESLTTLDQLADHFENFHLQFLLKLMPFLGFGIEEIQDLTQNVATHYPLDDEAQTLLKALWLLPYQEIIPLNLRQRRSFLDTLLRFYKSQVEDFGNLRSLPVLKSLFE